MNVVCLMGYMAKETQYVENDGQYEYRFYLKVNSTYSQSVSAIPCKCIGWLADRAYAQCSENSYMEILGEIVRDENSKVYVRVLNMITKKPRSRRQFYLSATEFIKAYNPYDVLERVEKAKNENK